MKRLIVAALFVAAFGAFAQTPAGGPKLIEAEGRLVTFRLVPGDKMLKVYLLGRKTAEVNWAKDARLVSVTALTGKVPEELSFREDGSAYLVSPVPESADLTLSLRAVVGGRKESVKIRLKKP